MNWLRDAGAATYTLAESAARTDEETSTDGATDGDHVEMASLHRLVEFDDAAVLRTALEGPQVQTIAGHEVFLVTPFAAAALVLARDCGMGSRSLFIAGDCLFVVHDGAGWTGQKEGVES